MFKREPDSGVERDAPSTKLQQDIDSHNLEHGKPPTMAASDCDHISEPNVDGTFMVPPHLPSEKDEPTAVHDTDFQHSLGGFRQATYDTEHKHEEFVTGARKPEEEIKELKKKISWLEREVQEQRDKKVESSTPAPRKSKRTKRKTF